jgi:hypothetical protein
MMPLRVAMPNRVMNPAIDATDGLPGPIFHLQANVDLRRLDTLHVLVEFRSTGSPGRRRYLRNAEHQTLERVPHSVGVGETRSGDRHRAHRQRTFVELRQE